MPEEHAAENDDVSMSLSKGHSAEKDAPPRCGEHFARHPDLPHLVAICTLLLGHEGAHDNLLTRVIPPARTEEG